MANACARIRRDPVPADELQRAKDHLKGNLVLSLESTTSRMSQLAHGRRSTLVGRSTCRSILDAIDAVSADDIVQRVATDSFRRWVGWSNGARSAERDGPCLMRSWQSRAVG